MAIRRQGQTIGPRTSSLPHPRRGRAPRRSHSPRIERLEGRELLNGGGTGFDQLPAAGEANPGGAEAPFQFRAHGQDYTTSITAAGAVFTLNSPASAVRNTLTMRLAGDDTRARVMALDPQPSLARSPHHSPMSGSASYGRIRYQGVYPGIDQVYHDNQGQLEYDFVVAPGADPGLIRLAFMGAESLALDEAGNLMLHLAGGDIVEHAPILYQEEAGGRQAVGGRYVLEGDGRVGFQVGAYDAAQPLVIDPTTTTTVTSSPGPSTYGQNVTFTATVTWVFGPVPAGSVTFMEGSTTLAGPLNLDTNGQASFAMATLSATASPHRITAFFSGFGTLSPSNGTMNQVVNPAPLTITPANAGRPYGAVNPTFTGTITGLQNGDVITATYATSAVPASPVGTYTIRAMPVDPAGRLGNYHVILNTATLTVTPAPLTVKADGKYKLYGAALPTLTATYMGFVLGQDATVLTGTLRLATPATLASPVGTYPITPSGLAAANYALAFIAGTLTVNPAPLAITAQDKTRTFGQANPAFTAGYRGLVLGENPGVLRGTLSFHTPATAASPVGTYPITLGGVSSANYDITFIAGVLTITVAPASVFALTGPLGPVTAGTAAAVTVIALDAFGNIDTAYTGTVHFSSGDPQAGLPRDYAFTAADRGVHTFAAAWRTAGSQSLGVTDVATPAIRGTYGPVMVLSDTAVAARLMPPASVTTGTTFRVTVIVLDAYGNTASGYGGTVHFTTAEGTTLLPGDYTFVGSDQGVHTFSGVCVRKVGNQILTITGTGLTTPQARATVVASNPVEEVFATGPDGQLHAQRLDTTGSPVGGTFLVAPGQVKTFRGGHDASGRPEVFVIGLDDQVWAAKFDAAGHPAGGYFLTSVGRVKALAAGQDASGAPEVFVIGLDDQVWAESFDAAGNLTSGYFLTSVGRVKALATGQDASGAPEVFVIGLDDQVWAESFDAAGHPTGGYFLAATGRVKALSVGRTADLAPELFVLGQDDQVWAEMFNAAGRPMGNYFLTQAGRVQALTSGRTADYNPEVFVLGQDDQVWAEMFDAAGRAAGTYLLTRPGRVKGMAVGTNSANAEDIFVLGLDDQVWLQHLQGRGTSGSGYELMGLGQVTALGVSR